MARRSARAGAKGLEVAVEAFLQKMGRRAAKAVNPWWWARRAAAYGDGREAGKVLALLRSARNGERLDAGGWQVSRLAATLRNAYTHCRYYRNLFDDVGFSPGKPEDFRKIPLLDKATVRSRASELVADNLRAINHQMWKTGGSTGEPLHFPLSYVASRIDQAHYEFTYDCMGYEPGDRIMAFSGRVIPDHLIALGVLWEDVPVAHGFPYGERYYSAFYTNEKTLPMLVQHVLDSRPSVLRGFPSLINTFAEYMIRNGIEVPFKVKGVQFVSEDVFPWQISNASKAFNARVFLQYGHSESCVFAYTLDESYAYYCSPFYGMTEILDSDGIHVGEGEAGEVVVTGLHNRALPLIRYRTGDIAVYRGNENGFVMLDRIQGRAVDYIRTADGDQFPISAMPELNALKHVYRWQVVQDVPGEVALSIVKEPDYDEEDEQELLACFRNQFGVSARIDYIDSIPLTQRGKVKLLVQNIDNSDASRGRGPEL